MEQPQRCVSESNPVLICRFYTFFVHDTPGRRSEIPNATLTCAMHVVREWGEGVARAGHTIKVLSVLCALLGTERRGDLVEQALPVCLFVAFEHLAADEKVYRVCFVCTLDSFLERERENARVVAQPPTICLGAREPCAVDTRLLPSARSDY